MAVTDIPTVPRLIAHTFGPKFGILRDRYVTIARQLKSLPIWIWTWSSRAHTSARSG